MECDTAEPQLSLILPQAGPLNFGNLSNKEEEDLPKFVYAYGSDFPKVNYSCVFGSTISVRGQWISTSLIRCEYPKNILIGPSKLTFGLIPLDSKQFVPNNLDWPTTHFTFFSNNCSPSCKGHCLGPLCLCPFNRTGLQCDQPFNKLTLNNTAILQKFNGNFRKEFIEFIPYIFKLPIEINPSNARLSLESDIEGGGGGLKLDPFQEQIYWSSPLGRSKPYSISLKIENDGEDHQLINWTIKVNPSYSAELERSLTLVNQTNGRELSGKIKWEGISNKKQPFAFNSSLPLLIHIYATDSAWPVPLEDLPIWTGRSSSMNGEEGDDGFCCFRRLLYPYLGTAEKIAITVRHPGSDLEKHLHSRDLHDETDALEWTQERVEITDYLNEVHPKEWDQNNKSLTLNYSLRLSPLGGDCKDGWRFEVLEPREFIFIVENDKLQMLQDKPGTYLLKLKFQSFGDMEISEENNARIPLRVVFMCMPTGQSLTIEQALVGLIFPGKEEIKAVTGAKLNPKRLFVDLNKNPFNVISLNIYLPNDLSNKLQKDNLKETESFLPFTLIWINRPSQNNWRFWLKLKSEEIEKYKNILNESGGNIDGAFLIKGNENLILSVPYRIQQNNLKQENDPTLFFFTLVVKGIGGGTNSLHPTDVELFTQEREQYYAKTLFLNTPEQFGPLFASLFQLKIRSRHFLPFTKLIRINPLDNIFIVELIPKPSQYFTFDGKQFNSEWQGVERVEDKEETSLFSPPIVHFRPAVFTPQSLSKFVDVVYVQGSTNSFVSVQPGWNSNNQILDFPMSNLNSSLCLGCGFRQLINLKQISMETKCDAMTVSVPFWSAQPIGHSPAILKFSQYFLLTSENNKINNEEEDIGENEEEENNKILNNDNQQFKFPRICHQKEDENVDGQGLLPFGFRTHILQNCALSHLRICRQLYNPSGPRCQNWWKQIPDSLLSVHSIAQFILLSVNCNKEKNSPKEMLKLIKCIRKVDWNCPLHPIESEMAPHIEGQIFNQVNKTIYYP
ncbi:unnamed protein product [Meloidogyne enterolobii]|uniref:Uncharacterized protein n=1 Tax=Meloidogyne enterolobii TaxID=390850 RepID=A0ACB0ZF35_MELEN